MKPRSLQNREQIEALLRTERRLILPVKWFLLLLSIVLWVLMNKSAPMREIQPFLYVVDKAALPWAIFGIIGGYALLNLAESWLLYFNMVSERYARTVALFSYLIDVAYVTLLLYLSLGNFYWVSRFYNDYYLLYFLLVMRGFMLFTTLGEMVLINTLISGMFTVMLWVQQGSPGFLRSPEFLVRLVLIWLVLFMAWFIMIVLNEQKNDLIRVHDMLMRRDNLARIGELASGVAHEIGNPLGIIIANAEYLKRMTPPDDPRMEDIETIHRETIRCREIVQQMLSFANPKPSENTLIEPREINDEVLNFLFPRGRTSRIEVIKRYGPNLPAFRADANLVKQALLNIYLNARQAIPEGEKGRILSRVHARRQPAGIVFEIEDNGSGINPEDLEHVFDPFFTRKPSGTGLGLPMTQRIVESFGGAITIEPARPKGTKVRIFFPPA